MFLFANEIIQFHMPVSTDHPSVDCDSVLVQVPVSVHEHLVLGRIDSSVMTIVSWIFAGSTLELESRVMIVFTKNLGKHIFSTDKVFIESSFRDP